MRLVDIDAIPESATAISTDGRLFVAWSEIVKAPTVDAVPVVRCKNCEHLYEFNGQTFCGYWTDVWDMPTEYEGFCHAGKEKK